MDWTPWWGAFEVPVEQARRWRVGPLELRVARLPHEWRIAWRIDGGALDETLEVSAPLDVGAAPSEFDVRRYASPRVNDTIELRVSLADRPIVMRPIAPFILLPSDEVVLYVSTPVWVVLWAGGPDSELFDVPSFRLSDTWSGRTTTAGDLCYASRTRARLAPELIKWRPGRAVTAITLRNRASTSLELTRVILPMPHLALYHDADHRLWTDGVVAEGSADAGDIDVRVVPPPVEDPRRLAAPRQGVDSNRIARVLGALFR